MCSIPKIHSTQSFTSLSVLGMPVILIWGILIVSFSYILDFYVGSALHRSLKPAHLRHRRGFLIRICNSIALQWTGRMWGSGLEKCAPFLLLSLMSNSWTWILLDGPKCSCRRPRQRWRWQKMTRAREQSALRALMAPWFLCDGEHLSG